MPKYKALLLASNIRSYVQARDRERFLSKLDNSNFFVDRLYKITNGKIKKIAFIAASPKLMEDNKEYAELLKASLNCDGFGVEEVVVIDCSFKGYLRDEILSSDMVYISRGNVPVQNEFFKILGLRNILKDYTGIILASGAGVINCSDKIYYQPRTMYEISHFLKDEDGKYRDIEGLGLIRFNVIPHLNSANIRRSSSMSMYERSLDDSYRVPHFLIEDGGFIEVDGDTTIRVYGETKHVKNGKATGICNSGEVLVLPPKTKENTNS